MSRKVHEITIGNDLSTGKPFKLDADEIIMGRTFLASITRYGKSWLNRHIIEQLVGFAGLVIIDPEGEYASLREKFPFLVIGKDIPLQIETAEFMAETTLKEGMSVIIDLSMIDEDMAKEYVAAFIKRFMFLETKLRKPYLIVCEEADEMMPEKGVAKATSLRAFKNVAKKGGKRGVGLIVTTHRPAFVSKMVLSQCTTLKVIGRIEWESDLNVIKDFLQVSPEILRRPKKNGKPINDGKPHVDCLEPGQFYFSGSAVEKDAFVKVGKVLTTHLGSTPELLPPAPRELEAVIAKLAETLPKIIEERIKPALPPIEEISREIERKTEAKLGKKLERDRKKLELKYRNKLVERDNEIKQLKDRVESVSRTAALTPSQNITDVLQHPIVKTTMLKLPERARALLTKIQREPNLTREQLAAFLTASRDTIASVVKKINRTFKASVIIGRGRPIKYRSLLERLFLTDVADREISAIERLQEENEMLKEDDRKLSERNRALYSENAMLLQRQKRMASPEQMSELQKENQRLLQLNKEEKQSTKEAKKQVTKLTKVINSVKKALELASFYPESRILLNEVKTETNKEDVPPENVVQSVTTGRITAFLLKHPGTFFTERELALALGHRADESFHNICINLPSPVEKTEKGFRIGDEKNVKPKN